MRWSRAGELACAFIDAPHERLQAPAPRAALEAIHRRTCVLPVRFGVAVRDEAEIHALLQARRGELLDRLEKLDGACEMGLRITLCTEENAGGQARPLHVPANGCRHTWSSVAPTIGRRMPPRNWSGRWSGSFSGGCKARTASGESCRPRLPM